MSTADEASKCIQHLHRTELHGKMISVERAKNEPGAQAKSMAGTPGPASRGVKAEDRKLRRLNEMIGAREMKRRQQIKKTTKRMRKKMTKLLPKKRRRKSL